MTPDEKPSNPAAFPVFGMYPDPSALNPGKAIVQLQSGMSLRDYFAGQALASRAKSLTSLSDQADFEKLANSCYRIADWMLVVRAITK